LLGAGDCIHIEAHRGDKIIGHLFIVLFDGEKYTHNTIIVPIDTLRSDKQDKTVTLQIGDHEFITDTSFVNYGFARVISLAYVDRLLETGKAKSKPSIGKEILMRVREGVRKSKRTPNDVLIAYSNHVYKELNKQKPKK
jgi:hypothetical protein